LGITSSERAKQTWSKPEFRQKMSLIASERQKRMWKDPEYRVKQTERFKAGKQTLSFKQNQSRAQKNRFSDPIEREKVRLILIQINPHLTGPDSPGWKGGVSTENERGRKSASFRMWRNSVFKKDNWTCQKCYSRGGKLHPHHIKPYALFKELRYDVNNGITLCADCHRELHSRKHCILEDKDGSTIRTSEKF